MLQCAQLFYRLEAAETMREYVAYNMDENEDLIANLEMAKNEAVVARRITEEGADLLRKAGKKNEAVQAKTCWLAEEKETMEVDKKKVEEEAARLRQEL